MINNGLMSDMLRKSGRRSRKYVMQQTSIVSKRPSHSPYKNLDPKNDAEHIRRRRYLNSSFNNTEKLDQSNDYDEGVMGNIKLVFKNHHSIVFFNKA